MGTGQCATVTAIVEGRRGLWNGIKLHQKTGGPLGLHVEQYKILSILAPYSFHITYCRVHLRRKAVAQYWEWCRSTVSWEIVNLNLGNKDFMRFYTSSAAYFDQNPASESLNWWRSKNGTNFSLNSRWRKCNYSEIRQRESSFMNKLVSKITWHCFFESRRKALLSLFRNQR